MFLVMNRNQAKQFAEVLNAWSDGCSIQYQNISLGEDWMDVDFGNFVINFGQDSSLNWRISTPRLNRLKK